MAGSVAVTGNIAVDKLGDIDARSDRWSTASRWTRSILADTCMAPMRAAGATTALAATTSAVSSPLHPLVPAFRVAKSINVWGIRCDFHKIAPQEVSCRPARTAAPVTNRLIPGKRLYNSTLAPDRPPGDCPDRPAL